MRRVLFTLMILVPLMLSAQMRLATVNVQAVYDAMPDKAAAEASLKTASDKYQAEYRQMQEEFDKKYADYQAIAADASTPATIKERRMQEIQENDKAIGAFLDRATADLKKMETDLQTPIYDKIRAAVRAVGEDAGVTYVIDSSRDQILYAAPNAIDLTQQVKNKLGIQ